MDWIWEILRYVAAWGGTGLVIWFWYWIFSTSAPSERRCPNSPTRTRWLSSAVAP